MTCTDSNVISVIIGIVLGIAFAVSMMRLEQS